MYKVDILDSVIENNVGELSFKLNLCIGSRYKKIYPDVRVDFFTYESTVIPFVLSLTSC